MRKAITLIGLAFIATATSTIARAADAPPAAPGMPVATSESPAPPPKPRPRIEIVAAFLPMSFGKFSAVEGGFPVETDASFAYGVSLAASYRIIAGLSVGIAPQMIFNVQPKDSMALTWPQSTETDYMLRIAYTWRPVDTIGLYAAVLPGTSAISVPGHEATKGGVFAFALGSQLDMTDQLFVDMGVGYQWGAQKVANANTDGKSKYVRIAVGLGYRFWNF